MKHHKHSVSVRSGQIEFVKLNTERWQLRDAYQRLLGLTWSRFALRIGMVYILINSLFATLYVLKDGCVAGVAHGDFFHTFFFSVQTIATVGYGNMYPNNLYGNIVTTIEIMSGVFLFAVITGLIFVRFSR